MQHYRIDKTFVVRWGGYLGADNGCRCHLHVVPWMVGFCLSNRLRRVSFLPFIMRGSGYLRRAEYGLTQAERRVLHDLVKHERREHIGRVDVRLLDFNARPIHVVEPDGRVILEGASEALDVLLSQIPAVGDDAQPE